MHYVLEINMKVLFVCDNYYPVRTASANCLQEIAQYLNTQSIKCDVLNVVGRVDLPEKVVSKIGNIYQLVNIQGIYIHSDVFRRLNFTLKCKVIISRIHYKFNRYPIRKSTSCLIRKMLNKIGSKYDVIIPLISDFNNGHACMKYCSFMEKPYIVYQVDPIADNVVYKDFRIQLAKFEKTLYSNAHTVITTPIISKNKQNDSAYDNCRIISVEFPNVRDLTNIKGYNRREIICSFCGYIYKGVRDSEYTLKLFSRCYDKSIHLRFAGTGQEKLVKKYIDGALKGRLEHVGEIDIEDSVTFMQNSDFLINIGNTVNNQVPSKLFDYISTGLPIINICKSRNCPTIPYLNKYGLAISIIEDEEKLNEQCEILEKFIHDNVGRRIQFEYIKEAFNENTAEYVGKAFIDTLSKINDN